MSDFGQCTPERKVLGELNNVKTEPLSPTANLRLLTTLASNLKNVNDQSNCDKNNQKTSSSLVTPSIGGLKLLPRKQKSLGLLCNKFLDMFPLNTDHDPPQEISLDGTAKALGTEKRRIYDIINVLESLEMASKAGKNRYIWHGQKGLSQTLAKLKSIAIKKLGLHEQIHEIQGVNLALSAEESYSSPCNSDLTISLDETTDEETFNDAAFKEDKSLGAMCQKFLMLFLVSMKNGVINLDIAAKVLITDMDNQANNVTKSRFKTKVRRLYDIANVLTAIGLINKVYTYDRTMRKPVFKYIGPEIPPDYLNSETQIQNWNRFECQRAPIGMSTPNKCSNNISSVSLQGINCNTWNGTRCKTFGNCSNTPITDKRKPRKRKLFDSDSFSESHNSLNMDLKSRSLDGFDYSILHVAEMELQRLNSSEESKPKACTKLIMRYNSDSCIDNSTSESSESIKIDNKIKTDEKFFPQDANISKIVISKKSQVKKNITNSISLNDSQTPKLKKEILKKLSANNNKIIESKIPTSSGQKLKTNIIEKTITELPRSNIELRSLPKIIVNFDKKKLIPIKRCDLKLSFPAKSNTLGQGYAVLTRIQAPVVSPGDTFKAVKVGNTLQLVPMKINCSNDNNNVENTNIDDNI